MRHRKRNQNDLRNLALDILAHLSDSEPDVESRKPRRGGGKKKIEPVPEEKEKYGEGQRLAIRVVLFICLMCAITCNIHLIPFVFGGYIVLVFIYHLFKSLHEKDIPDRDKLFVLATYILAIISIILWLC